MIVIGLTGSIGMGKSTTAQLFRECGLPVHSSDEAVHRLYQPRGRGAEIVRALAPSAISRDGSVDRQRLRVLAQENSAILSPLEEKIHPLVSADREAFLARAVQDKAEMVVVDVPLLFETGIEKEMDLIVVVSAPKTIQRERVLQRQGMDEGTLETILARQMADSLKRARADYVVETGAGIAAAREQVEKILETIRLEARRTKVACA